MLLNGAPRLRPARPSPSIGRGEGTGSVGRFKRGIGVGRGTTLGVRRALPSAVYRAIIGGGREASRMCKLFCRCNSGSGVDASMGAEFAGLGGGGGGVDMMGETACREGRD